MTTGLMADFEQGGAKKGCKSIFFLSAGIFVRFSCLKISIIPDAGASLSPSCQVCDTLFQRRIAYQKW